MAVRGKNPHWTIRGILRRHWLALGAGHGIVTDDGRQAQFILNELIARTPGVIEAVRAKLPMGFPGQLADSIFGGLQNAAERLEKLG